MRSFSIVAPVALLSLLLLLVVASGCGGSADSISRRAEPIPSDDDDDITPVDDDDVLPVDDDDVSPVDDDDDDDDDDASPVDDDDVSPGDDDDASPIDDDVSPIDDDDVSPVDDDDVSPVDDDDDDNDDSSSPLNVTEEVDLNAQWVCEDPGSCIADYLLFPSLAAAFANPITEEEMEAGIDAIFTGQVTQLEDAIPADQLSAAIIDALNIGFLRDGLDERSLAVKIIRQETHDDFYEEELLFTDPYVGTFQGILVTPLTAPPYPAVVAIHGHGQSAEMYLNQFQTWRFAENGLAILMLTMRAMAADEYEDQVVRNQLLNGFTLLGLRSYETVLGLKYLRWRGDIDPNHLGLIGHSGGSVASNLTVRLDPNFKAYVSDCQSNYVDDYRLLMLDETVPALYPYVLLINDYSTSTTPILQVPYEYIGAMDDILAFFVAQLQGD